MTPTVFRIALVLLKRAAGLGGFQILREKLPGRRSAIGLFLAGNTPIAVQRHLPDRPENLAYWWMLGRS
jgi:hypothetical protein